MNTVSWVDKEGINSCLVLRSSYTIAYSQNDRSAAEYVWNAVSDEGQARVRTA
jgi:hypothetical protein